MTVRAVDLRVLSIALAGVALVLATAALGQEADTLASRGKRLFTEQGCYGCHMIGKMGTPIATDLSQIGTRYTEAYLHQWLREPQQQKPRAHMPKIEMAERDARALAAYLASLR